MSVYNRAKAPCEVFNDATLSVHFEFDGVSLLTDSGPNGLSATSQNVSSFTPGQYQNALLLTGSARSYFQIIGVTSIGITDRAFSISLWIRPTNLSGIVVHVSEKANVAGGWCIPFIGFASNGSIAAQVFDGSVETVYGPRIPTSSVWTHVVETWSSTTGLRLYVNNVLVGSRPTVIRYRASSDSNFVTLGNDMGSNCYSATAVLTTPFAGVIDDFRIYSQLLTADDVCALYNA